MMKNITPYNWSKHFTKSRDKETYETSWHPHTAIGNLFSKIGKFSGGGQSRDTDAKLITKINSGRRYEVSKDSGFVNY